MADNDSLICAVFDVDGTLIDSASIVVEAVTKMCEKNNIKIPPANKIVSGIGLSLEDALLRIMPEEEHENINKLADDYRILAYDIRKNYVAPLYDGALDFLSFLEEKNVLLAISTGNSKKGVEVALRPHNIINRFISIKTADICKGKPNPEMLDEIAKETGVKRANIVMIGDSIYDMQMAKNAGTKAIGVSWGYHDAEALSGAGADVIANSFSDMKNLFVSVFQD